MNNSNGNSNNNGPSFPLWKVLLTLFLALAVMWVFGSFVFNEGGTP